MVDALDIIIAVASFGPAMALMYFTLRNYTFPRVEKPFFDDRKVFALMTFGIVLGMIFFFVDSAMRSSISLETILLIALTVPLLQSLIKLAILNWPKFQRKVDTAFYGLALGMGIAATYAFAQMEYAVRYPGFIGLETLDALGIITILMLGVQVVLIQGSTTAMIGVGCARGEVLPYFANSLTYALLYSFMLYGSALLADMFGDIAAILTIVAIWVVCIYSFWRVYKIDYPQLVIDARRGLKKARKRPVRRP
ncbi:MAG: hypothetical protein OEV21_06500 [Thermoplasmata archaeon]|nr:hypothetical protein [Thermoplasmata archaeon]